MVDTTRAKSFATLVLATAVCLSQPALAGGQPSPNDQAPGGSGFVTPPAGGSVTSVSPSFGNSSEAVAAPASTQLINVPVFAGGQGNRAGSSNDECYLHVTTAQIGGGYAASDVAGGLSSFSIGGQLVVPLNGRMGKICAERSAVHLQRDRNRVQYERNADALARFKACNQAYLGNGLNSPELCNGFVPFRNVSFFQQQTQRPVPSQRSVAPAPVPVLDGAGALAPSDF